MSPFWKSLSTKFKQSSTEARPSATELAASTNDTSVLGSGGTHGTDFTAALRSEIEMNTRSSLPKRYGSPFVYNFDAKKTVPLGWVTRIDYKSFPLNSENQHIAAGWFVEVTAKSGTRRTFRLEQFPQHLQSLLTSGPQAPAYQTWLRGALVDAVSSADGVDTWRLDVRYNNNWTVSPTTHRLQKASASMIARAPGRNQEKPSRTRRLRPGQIEKLTSDLGVIVEES